MDFTCPLSTCSVRLLSSVFQSILKVLESPNSWDAFRRAGGFTGLLSLVVDIEGALSDPPQADVWKSLGYQPLLDLLLLSLHILTLAVHLHAVNAHHFETGGFYERLGEALLQLGCFKAPEKDWFNGEGDSCLKISEEHQSLGKSFHQFVELAEAPEAPPSPSSTPQLSLPVTLRTCLRVLSYLDQFATGTYPPLEFNVGLDDMCDADKDAPNKPAGPGPGVYSGSSPVGLGSGPQSVEDSQGRSRNAAHSVSTVCSEPQYRWIFMENSAIFLKNEPNWRGSVCDVIRFNNTFCVCFLFHLAYSRFSCNHIILHPGAIRVILTLLPSVFSPEDPQVPFCSCFILFHTRKSPSTRYKCSPCLPAVYGGPVLTGSPPPGHGQV